MKRTRKKIKINKKAQANPKLKRKIKKNFRHHNLYLIRDLLTDQDQDRNKLEKKNINTITKALKKNRKTSNNFRKK